MTRIGGSLLEHGDDLHVAGLRAQQQRAAVALAGHVEGVVVGAGGVVRGDVERAEIEPVGLDVEALADAEAHGAEDRGHLLHRAADRVDQAVRPRRRRQGDVDALGGEPGVDLGAFERGAAGLDDVGELVLQAVQRGAALAPLLGGGVAERFEQEGELARLAERADADGVPGAQVGRFARAPLRFRRAARRGRRSSMIGLLLPLPLGRGPG